MIHSIEFRAMNTTVMLAAEGALAIDGLHAAKAFIDDSEQRFSRFLPASENAELNRSAGEWLPISDQLMDMLQLSVKYYRETHGIFDPSILPDLKRLGYDRSMDEIRLNGTSGEPVNPRRTSQSGFQEISFNLVEQSVCLPHDLEIDLTGIAKGWIVEKAAQLLHAYSPACGVSAGGDILFIGQPSDGMDWDVYLEDPREPTQMLAQLHIPSGAVATSSVLKRSWTQGTQLRHHLIDPRTGEPAATDWASVTVISSNIVEADVYAKAILIGGREIAAKLMETNSNFTYIAVTAAGELVGSPKFKDYMYEPATNLFVSSRLAS